MVRSIVPAAVGLTLLVAALPGPSDAGTVLCERKKRVRLRVDVCKPGETFVLELGDPGNSLDQGVATNASDLAGLESSVATNAASIANLDAALSAVEGTVLSAAELALVRELLAVLSRVDLDQGDGTPAPTLRLSGVNLQIVDGSGSTAAPNAPGVGNLIVGYSEHLPHHLLPRTGSHTLVVGPEHSWTGYGGIVAGSRNRIFGAYPTVTGGSGNEASGDRSSVSGGSANRASGPNASVSGGISNHASGWVSSVSGGHTNRAQSPYSSVSGGYSNTASGYYSSVSGGAANRAEGRFSSVSGGTANQAIGLHSSVSSGILNTASGVFSTVSGGDENSASGSRSTVSGGYQNSSEGYRSTVSGGSGNTATADESHVP